MPYVEIPSMRIAYNVDGTKVGYNTSSDFGMGVTNWCTQTELDNLNKENQLIITASLHNAASGNSNVYVNRCYYFFFTEPKQILGLLFRQATQNGQITAPVFSCTIQGSADSVDGIGGAWENATFGSENPWITSATDTAFWRKDWKPISFSKPVNVLRIMFKISSGVPGASTTSYSTIWGALALYGNSAPTGGHYLTILSGDDNVKDRLIDFGDIEEGASATQTFKLRNDSTTKTANTIALSLSGQDAAEFTVSLDNSTFAATQTIANLAPGTSATVYVKNTKPIGNVGPKQAVLKADVGSWS